jgi:hypothetical protein
MAGKTILLTLRVTPGAAQRIKEAAAELGVTQTELLLNGAALLLAQHKKEAP